MTDPTTLLRQAMAEVGLHPKQIIWDGKWHRFPGIEQNGRGDNGRYKAFVDRRGALFMDMRTKEKWKWPQDNPAWREKMRGIKPLSAAEVKRKQAEAERQNIEDTKKATKIIRDLWERAKDCANHPYLKGKGISDVALLKSIIDPKTEQEMLLIPMRNSDGEIWNIQRIWPNGRRQQMWQPGGSSGLYNTIGAQGYEQTKTIYICEGWATGWTIHRASGCAVIVAFFDGGLLTVGKIIAERYPEARLVFAADNDRWKPVNRGGRMVNPGVYAAKRAARALNAAYCTPDFPDLSTNPTDYDDLRQLAGLDVVRQWLDPAKASQAVIVVPEEEPDPEPWPEPDPEPEPKKKRPRRGKKIRPVSFYDNHLADMVSDEDRQRWISDPRHGWYRAPAGRWTWRLDPKGARLRRLLKRLAEDRADELNRPLNLRNTTVIGAINMLAAELQASPAWDRRPMIAGLPGAGDVLDLTTAHPRPAKRDEFVSRRLGVRPDPDGKTPERFLELVHDMVQDRATADWLLAWFGYLLTGYTFITDHATPMLIGDAGAGKSTLIEIITHIMGGYTCQLPPDVLVGRRGARDRHDEWKVNLDGARLAVATEIPEKGRLRAGIFKELTGGSDAIRANRMRMDSYEFVPTARYLLYGNLPPSLPGWDDGLKRRVVFVECHAKPKSERVEGLGRQIIDDEAEAILAFLADQAASGFDRHSEGRKWLPEPSGASAERTGDLFEDNDVLGGAIRKCFVFTGQASDVIASKDIRVVLTRYYEEEGHGKPPSNHTVIPALRRAAQKQNLWFGEGRDASTRGWGGIAFKT